MDRNLRHYGSLSLLYNVLHFDYPITFTNIGTIHTIWTNVHGRSSIRSRLFVGNTLIECSATKVSQDFCPFSMLLLTAPEEGMSLHRMSLLNLEKNRPTHQRIQCTGRRRLSYASIDQNMCQKSKKRGSPVPVEHFLPPSRRICVSELCDADHDSLSH